MYQIVLIMVSEWLKIDWLMATKYKLIRIELYWLKVMISERSSSGQFNGNNGQLMLSTKLITGSSDNLWKLSMMAWWLMLVLNDEWIMVHHGCYSLRLVGEVDGTVYQSMAMLMGDRIALWKTHPFLNQPIRIKVLVLSYICSTCSQKASKN